MTRYLPAAASTPGVNGTYFRTDARVFNPDPTDPVTVMLAFLPSGADNRGTAEVSITILPRHGIALEDLVGTLFGASGSGAVRLRSDRPFFAASRTYNIGTGTSGTFGQRVPALTPEDALRQAILLQLANDPSPSGFRSNVGFVNPDLNGVTVSFRVYDTDDATLLGVGQRVLPPLGYLQVNDVFAAVGAQHRVIGNATAEVSASAPVFFWASVLDNASGDAIFVLPQADEGTPVASNRAPVGTIDSPAGDTSIAGGQSVYFAGSASDPDGDQVGVTWDFGDDTTSSALAPGNHTYAAAGEYTVRFTATDEHGLADWTPPLRHVSVTGFTVTRLQDDLFTALTQVPLSIPAAGVLGNDRGAYGASLEAELATAPARGGVVLEADGSFEYQFNGEVGTPAEDSFTYRAGGEVATVRVTLLPEVTLTDLRVAYRLDPWLISGTYTNGIWVSPTVFGPARQAGNVFTMQVRAEAHDEGTPVRVGPTWVPGDPSIVTVSPSQGDEVTMTVWGAGETTLYVGAQGVSRTLGIAASVFQGVALELQISQP